MKKLSYLLFLTSILFFSCEQGGQYSSAQSVDAATFSERLKNTESPQLVDVRTPDEFADGHIEGAVNINWNSNNFLEKTKILNKEKEVFVYCLSGGRSAEAVKKMRTDGFKNITELKGGILKWRIAGLPEIKPGQTTQKGMSVSDFEKLLETDKKVLIDFYAEWCAPCKKMEPFLAELKTERAADVVIIRIDLDANSHLASELGVDILPTLMYFKNKQLLWRNTGFMTKEDLSGRL